MATYAAYRHIELDKVGYSKKRVRNPPSDINNVMTSPTTERPRLSKSMVDGASTPRRRSTSNADSFNRLFGDSPSQAHSPRRASLTKHDVTNRNPVTGDGVQSWDSRVIQRASPKALKERNPVTGEMNQKIASPVSTPTKGMNLSNDFVKINAAVVTNGNSELPSGPITNGQA